VRPVDVVALIRLMTMENIMAINKNPKEQIKKPMAPYKIICNLLARRSSSISGSILPWWSSRSFSSLSQLSELLLSELPLSELL